MPKLIALCVNDTCFLCGNQAFYVSVNSKRFRCVEKITKCPGFVKKAEESRKRNMPAQVRKEHMKKMSKLGHEALNKNQKNLAWVLKKSKNISKSITERGGHSGKNNPMYNKTHTTQTKKILSKKANNRNPVCYVSATNTKILNGNAIPKNLKSNWEIYREQVFNVTLRNWKQYHHIINPLNLPRGKLFELDHKFSIAEGFKQNVDPSIIGHYHNLEILPTNKNRSKRMKCSISLSELNFMISDQIL